MLLRKAKVEAEQSAPAANAVSRNADFIGFGDDEDDTPLVTLGGVIVDDPSEEGEIDSDTETQPTSQSNGGPSRPAQNSSLMPINAPSGPSSFSHLRNLHNTAESQTNGTTQASTQAVTPAEAPMASEKTLDEARNLLAEINAQEGKEPQTTNRHTAPHSKKRRVEEGDITKTWAAKDRASSTPWHIDHSRSPDTVYWQVYS
jgi:hypothetical protein